MQNAGKCPQPHFGHRRPRGSAGSAPDSAAALTPAGQAFRGSLISSSSAGRPACTACAAAASAYARIADTLLAQPLQIVQERLFASRGAEAAVKAARRETLQSRGIPTDGPLTCIEGRPVWGEGFAGAILRAVAGRPVRTILEGHSPCGRTWQTDEATFLVLQNLQGSPPSPDDPPASQARRAIQQADRVLRRNGATHRHTVRTWFYLSNILGWYGPFNRVRSEMYRAFGLWPAAGERPGHLPASTGIRADSPGGAVCSLDLLAAIGPGGEPPAIECLRNPRQQEAFCYGSAFSRGAVLHGSCESLVEVSGTAAIDEKGRSLHPGDVRAQARCTLEKTAAILRQARASFRDLCAATVFLKHGRDAEAVREVLADLGIERLPAVWVDADVCRPELLFEIDAEAVVPRQP